MSKHKLNTYQESTNKFLKLTKEEQTAVSDLATNAIKRAFEGLSEFNSIQTQHLKQEFFKNYVSLEADKIFLTKERDAYKKQIRK
jgi:uncharacterized protein YjdB